MMHARIGMAYACSHDRTRAVTLIKSLVTHSPVGRLEPKACATDALLTRVMTTFCRESVGAATASVAVKTFSAP
jgi:hypothetical protein